MRFCYECGGLLPAGANSGECEQCGATFGNPGSAKDSQESDSNDTAGHGSPTELESVPTTSSGSIKKGHAMEWLENLSQPSQTELKKSVIEKPSGFSGSTFPTDILTIRLTGDPQFIETIAGLFSWIVEMEDYSRRVGINLKETEDRETGEQTGNYALYLSITERG